MLFWLSFDLARQIGVKGTAATTSSALQSKVFAVLHYFFTRSDIVLGNIWWVVSRFKMGGGMGRCMGMCMGMVVRTTR